jgi:hypothetical protein
MRTGTQRTRMTGWMAAAVMLGSAAPVRADVVLDWNATMMQTITGLSPFGTQRLTAITQLAVFEAVNAVTGGYEPYLDTITAPAGASPEAAAAAAAHGVLTFYYPAKAGALDAALALSLAAIPDGPAEDDGVAVGAAGVMTDPRRLRRILPPRPRQASGSRPRRAQRALAATCTGVASRRLASPT